MTLQNILDNVNDYVGNYSTGTEDPNAKIRAVNRAIEFLKRKLGFPCDEVIQTFFFSEDQIYYDLESDFDESIKLLYHDITLNIPGREWNYYSYPDILRSTGGSRGYRYGFTGINGKKQLVIFGSNIRKGQTLFTFDAIGNWTATDDASNLALDTFQKYNGDSSFSFDITNNTGIATLQVTGLALDMYDLFQNNGFVKFWTWMSDNNIDDVTLKLMTDNSNYYSITTNLADDGTAFSEDQWIKLGFSVNDAVAVGTPDAHTITKIRIEFDLGAGFTTATDFRVDYMFTTYPDEMDLIYYSSIKGTDSTGATAKQLLDTASDKVTIGEFFYDYIDVIARRAALNIYPQLRGDKEWYTTYVADLNDCIKTLGRSYPRKRTANNIYRHKIKRN